MVSSRVVSLVTFLSIVYYEWGIHPALAALPPSNHLDDPEIALLEDLDDLATLEAPPDARTSVIPIGNPYDITSDKPGQPLNPSDFSNSQAMDDLPDCFQQDPSIVQDPIEFAGLFEGDIIINTPADMPVFDSAGPVRNAIVDDYKQWPHGVIPYLISSSYTSHERGTIAQAIQEFHTHTCIRYVPRTVEKDYIHILKQSGCTPKYQITQGQTMRVGNFHSGIPTHDQLYSIIRRRDLEAAKLAKKWLKIIFYKTDNTNSTVSLKYDVGGSIMHYGPLAFAKDRSKPTISPHSTSITIGQRKGFSQTDIQKLKKLYNCAGVEPTITTTPKPIPGPKPVPVSKCVDNNQYCKAWADLGECNNNPEWMNLNCKKACNKCGTTCQDQSSNCSYWASKGECTRNAEYMSLFCKKSFL
ncbi:unnamed protein product, partial [Meganyctiphanes norvegica]